MKNDVIDVQFTRKGIRRVAWVMFADADVVRTTAWTKNGAVRKALRQR